jgi:hypothetical protein
MNRVKFLTGTLLVFFLLTAFLPAEVKTNGYFSFEYLKSQSEGAWPKGTFSNLSGGFILSGTISGPLAFLAEVQGRMKDSFSLQQAYLLVQASALFNFKFGLLEIPFGRFNTSARPAENLTILPPLPFHFFPWRWHDLGLSWEGHVQFFYYSAYLVNGLSANSDGYLVSGVRDQNKNKGAGSRLAIRLGEGFELGGSFYSGKYDSSGVKDVQFQGLDLIWVTTDWEVRGEYIKSIYDHPFLGEKKGFDGYYVTVGMNFQKMKLYFSFQNSAVPASTYVFDDFTLPAINVFMETMVRKDRKAIGLKWDVLNNLFAKLEFDWNKEKEIKIKDNNLTVQLGFVF